MKVHAIPRVLLEKSGEVLHPLLWRLFSARSRRVGLKRLYFILSFDCDTAEDARAAMELDPWLAQRGICRVYAVPGSQLEKDAGIYQAIAKAGAEFINHGYRPHTTWNGQRYVSSAFYHLLRDREIREDVRAGHETVRRITGTAPQGFRAPHFGALQHRPQMKIVLDEIGQLNYRFSTQTLPEAAFLHSPAWRKNNLLEFPLSGSAGSPFVLLDSYGLIHSPERREVTAEYGIRLRQTFNYLRDCRVCGVLNLYADPSHVYRDPGFLGVMDEVSRWDVASLTFADLLALVGG